MGKDNDRKSNNRFVAVFATAFILLIALVAPSCNDDTAGDMDFHYPGITTYTRPTLPDYTFATVPLVTMPPAYEYDPDLFPDQGLDDIEVIRYPGRVKRNEVATIRIKGEPNTKFSITVMYPSGASTAEGLQDKRSDSNGYVTWRWRIGGRTSYGTHKITITDGENTITISFRVVG